MAFYQAYRRRSGWLSLLLPLAIAVTGAWSFVLLRRTPGWNPWLSWTVLGATVVAVLVLAFGWLRARRSDEDVRSAEDVGERQSPVKADRGGRRFAGGRRERLLTVAGVAGLIAVLAGPAAYAMTPLSRPIEGTNPVGRPDGWRHLRGRRHSRGCPQGLRRPRRRRAHWLRRGRRVRPDRHRAGEHGAGGRLRPGRWPGRSRPGRGRVPDRRRTRRVGQQAADRVPGGAP